MKDIFLYLDFLSPMLQVETNINNYLFRINYTNYINDYNESKRYNYSK